MRQWPITARDARKVLGFNVPDGDVEELGFYAEAACSRIDRETGRDVEPHRHEVNGQVPVDFVMAARILVRMAWQQDKNSPRMGGEQPGIQGIDLPRRVQGILALYPPPPGFGQGA